MRAVEVIGKVDDQGQLLLDEPLEIKSNSRVKVILLISDDDEFDPNDTPVEEIQARLIQALKEVKAGKTRPVSELWDEINDHLEISCLSEASLAEDWLTPEEDKAWEHL